MSNIIRIIKRVFGKSKSSKQVNLEYWEKHGFKHGKNFCFYSDYAIDSNLPWLIEVGDNVTFSSDVRILGHDASTVLTGVGTKIGRVIIGNNVFIGAGSVVLCNTRIGDDVIIGANSLVSKDLPSNGVYAGNPAKFICTFEEYKQKHLNNLKTHKFFDSIEWDKWKDATPKEWDEMKKDLEDTFGYF